MNLVSEVFTDTDGSAPNPVTWTAATSGSSTITVVSNALKVSCGAVASEYGNAWLMRQAVSGDIDLYFDFIVPNPIAGAARQSMYWHNDQASPLNCWVLLFRQERPNYEVGYYTNDVFTNLSTTLAAGTAAGDTVHFRVQHRGNNVKVKKWLNAAVEPATWTLDMTATAGLGQFPLGTFCSLELYNNTAAACSASFDNIVITTPDTYAVPVNSYYRR